MTTAGPLITVALSVALVESVARLPFGALLRRVARVSRRALWVTRSRWVSEPRKERVTLAYAGALFGASLALAGMLAVLALLAGAMVWAAERAVPGVVAFVLGPLGLALSAASATLYALLRAMVRRHAVR